MAPDSTSPSGSLLLTLPPELLHQVFSELPLEDVHATRKTCVLLGTIGLDYLCDEIPLIYHTDSFKALTQIAEHLRYSKRVRALFYIIDRCKLASFDEWDADRRDPKPAPWAADAPSREGDSPSLECSDAELLEREIREEKEYLEGRPARIAAVPLITRQLGYIAYSELCQAQMKILKEEYDIACLRTLMQGCAGFREATIASHMCCERRLTAEKSACADAMTTLSQDWDWATAGYDQVLGFARAARHAGVKLDSLTLAGISHSLFDASTEGGHLLLHRLTEVVKPLRRLRLIIQAWPPEKEASSDDEWSHGDPESSDDEVQYRRMQNFEVFRAGFVTRMLAQARELRILKLSLPLGDPWDPTSEGVRLEHTLRNITFPHLCELSLSQCEVKAGYLVRLLMRHKATLRRLSLSDIILANDEVSWRKVFKKLGGQLPNLCRARLRGNFGRVEDFYPPLQLGFRTFEHDCATPFRDALENFIVKGGHYPADLPLEIHDPEETYVPRTLPEDKKEPDDPALDYESDEFDDQC